MTSTFEKIIDLGTNYIHLVRNVNVAGSNIEWIGRWDGNAGTFESVGGGTSSFTLGVVSVPGTDNVYVCGAFSQVGGSVSANRIAYYNGSSWDALAGATVFNNTVQSMAYDSVNGLLYASSYQTTNTTNRISRWNGTSWTGIAEPTVSTYCKLTIDGDGNLYAGYGSTFKRYVYQSSTWELLDASIGGTISDIKYNDVDNRVYITLNISSGASVKYYDITGNTISSLPDLGYYTRAVAFDSNNDVYVACQSPTTYQGTVVKYNSNSNGWDNIYNYQDTSGVLDLEIDANDNIFAYANAGSIVIGTAPYGVGNWEGISASTSVNYGGPRSGSPGGGGEEAMNFQVGDNVCLTLQPTQHGTIHRLHPLGVQNAVVVEWNNGPEFNQGKKTGYFGDNLSKIEHL